MRVPWRAGMAEWQTQRTWECSSEVEHRTFNPGVEGSNPSTLTKNPLSKWREGSSPFPRTKYFSRREKK